MKQIKHIFLTTTLVATLLSSQKSVGQSNSENKIDSIGKVLNGLKNEIDVLKRIKLSGYIQTQWQIIDSAGAPSYAGGDFTNGSSPVKDRFTIRRGRVKVTYEQGIGTFLLNTDYSEKGVFMRETYVKLTEPWTKSISLTIGCVQTPFGFEPSQSSSVRETPERARYNQILFPTERDLGAFLTYQASKSSLLNGLTATFAVVNGSGNVTREFDTHKDFVGRLIYGRTTKNEKFSYRIGASYYKGGFKQGVKTVYDFGVNTNNDDAFIAKTDTSNFNTIAKKEFMAADFEVSLKSVIGQTTIRAEYVQGEQPGINSSMATASAAPVYTDKIYHKNFNAGYIYFIQNIGKSKFQIVAKYDFFDPNVKISGKQIGKAGTNTGKGDIMFETYGFGLTYQFSSNLKFVAYYDLVKNEKTSVASYNQDIRDNVTTLRLQMKF
ncbi:MAG: hypothetical protein IT234_01655 [Bacteroidia bacterium]|nr:hypothetical protein [Bacteroidia bacterium]